MKGQYFKHSSADGAVLPIFAVCLLLLLTLAGLALDAGILFQTRLRLQRAADAGVVAALGYRASKGWFYFNRAESNLQDPALSFPLLLPALGVAGERDAEAVEVAKHTIAANLRVAGIPVASGADPGAHFGFGDASSDAVRFSSLDDTISVEIWYDAPLFLLSHLPGQHGCGTGGRCRVSVVAEGQLEPANIGIVLDTSGSMACPRAAGGNGACPCAADDSCPTPSEKLSDVIQAVFTFASYFNPNKDRLNIVPFGTVADDSYFSIASPSGAAWPFGADAARFATFVERLQTLEASGNTNTCEGLLASLEDMQRVSAPALVGNEELFVVLFTDGAPTAATYSLNDPADDSIVVSAGLTNRWTQFALEWRREDGSEYPGPSPFVYRDALNRIQSGIPLNGPQVCGTAESDEDRYDASLRSCVTSFDFSLPGYAERAVGSELPLLDYRQQFYHCAIEASDRIRASRGQVFSIGVGPQAFAASNDPYQNVFDDYSRKEHFLRRIALDPFTAEGPEFDAVSGLRRRIQVNDQNDPRFGETIESGYVGYRTFEELAQDRQVRERDGAYYGTENTEELRFLFARVAKQILLRLTR